MIAASPTGSTASKPTSIGRQVTVTMVSDRLSFPLETLLAASDAVRPIDLCARGHLRVAGRTCWTPVAFEPGPRAVICEPAKH